MSAATGVLQPVGKTCREWEGQVKKGVKKSIRDRKKSYGEEDLHRNKIPVETGECASTIRKTLLTSRH